MDDAEEFRVDAGCELRFETAQANQRVTCRLQQGDGSVFGTPINRLEVYTFPEGTKAAIYSQGGCKVQLRGHKNARQAESSTSSYTGLLSTLRQMREGAKRSGSAEEAPRVLVVGPTDAGKSTLCKQVLNNATSDGYGITFVDCDLGQNSITCPGSIATCWLNAGEHVDIQEGLNLLPPLAFYFGDLSVNKDNIHYYGHLCGQSYACIRANQENRTSFAPGGIVINTMGWTTSFGYQAIKLIAAAFHVNVVVVMQDSTLAEELRGDLRQQGLEPQFVEMSRPDGVVVRQQGFRREQRGLRLREYFCGVKTKLVPARVVVPIDSVSLFKIGDAGKQAQPGVPQYLSVSKQEPGPQHQLCVAAVSHAQTPDEIPHANVAGFVVILTVNLDQRELTLLSPSDTTLPRPFLVVSSQKMAYEDTLV
eukprot:TRINITY_DN8041_c0_g1_i1.p1 TRINITY_DN8041_c0_g1~~TRINITY_DN8041_c0_g1_i1.p1  ORF type:complete len:453 (+),score=164.03 TRINITY_DN8041_c0_g1_i1:97-1359(+)